MFDCLFSILIVPKFFAKSGPEIPGRIGGRKKKRPPRRPVSLIASHLCFSSALRSPSSSPKCRAPDDTFRRTTAEGDMHLSLPHGAFPLLRRVTTPLFFAPLLSPVSLTRPLRQEIKKCSRRRSFQYNFFFNLSITFATFPRFSILFVFEFRGLSLKTSSKVFSR